MRRAWPVGGTHGVLVERLLAAIEEEKAGEEEEEAAASSKAIAWVATGNDLLGSRVARPAGKVKVVLGTITKWVPTGDSKGGEPALFYMERDDGTRVQPSAAAQHARSLPFLTHPLRPFPILCRQPRGAQGG